MAIAEGRSMDLFLHLRREINDVRFGGGFHRNAMYLDGHEPIFLVGDFPGCFSITGMRFIQEKVKP
jgi:hypothetical protein